MDFISAEYYQPIFLITITIFSFFTVYKYSVIKDSETLISQNKSNVYVAFILSIIFTFFIGFRSNSIVFADTTGYVDYFIKNASQIVPFSWETNTENLIFDNLLMYLAKHGFSYSFFFTIIAAIYFIGAYYACKRFFPCHILAAYLVFLGAFSTFSSATNGIKSGAAASVFLLALTFRERKLWITIILGLISWGFHHSMTVCLIASCIVYLYHNTKVYYVLWIVCLLIAAFHITYFQELFAGFTDEKASSYLLLVQKEGIVSYYTGFRLDFIIYSVMPIIVGYYAVFKKKIKNQNYIFLLNLYVLLNSIWLLAMYASYTNRIAYLSWMLYPIVLIYPFLNCRWGENRYKIFANVMVIHLAFTLFMKFIYYGVIR